MYATLEIATGPDTEDRVASIGIVKDASRAELHEALDEIINVVEKKKVSELSAGS